MTTYEVTLSQTALRQFKALDKKMQDRMHSGLNQLKEDPFVKRPKADIKKLKGPNRDYYRLRVGKFRAIYVVEEMVVKVAKILPRSDAYKWLE